MDNRADSIYTTHFGQEHDSVLSPGLRKLRDEHPPLIRELEDLLRHIDSGIGLADDDAWAECVARQEVFVRALEEHSEKEERLLFPVLKERIGTAYGPIEIMEVEHEDIRRHLHAFAREAGSKGRPTPAEASELSGFLQQAQDIMLQHFYKEEHAIYPMAEAMLSDQEKEAIGHACEEGSK